MIKVEMHCHTRFSQDGFITAKTLTKQCRKRQVDCVCITDHNTLKGAIELSGKVPIKIVKGQEISTGQGDLIGFFLNEEIPRDLGLRKSVDIIKAQGGLVFLPHPFDEFRKSAVKLHHAEQIKNEIDIVEVFNSRTFDAKYNRMALEFAQKNNIVVAVGSDAHHHLEIGRSYMRMEDFETPESFLKNLKNATYVANKCPFALRLYIKALKIITGKD